MQEPLGPSTRPAVREVLYAAVRGIALHWASARKHQKKHRIYLQGFVKQGYRGSLTPAPLQKKKKKMETSSI